MRGSTVIHKVSALTPTPLLLSSLVDMLQAGLYHYDTYFTTIVLTGGHMELL